MEIIVKIIIYYCITTQLLAGDREIDFKSMLNSYRANYFFVYILLAFEFHFYARD